MHVTNPQVRDGPLEKWWGRGVGQRQNKVFPVNYQEKIDPHIIIPTKKTKKLFPP